MAIGANCADRKKAKVYTRDQGQKTQDRQKTKDNMAAKKTKIAAADDKRLRETPQDESENISGHVYSKLLTKLFIQHEATWMNEIIKYLNI